MLVKGAAILHGTTVPVYLAKVKSIPYLLPVWSIADMKGCILSHTSTLFVTHVINSRHEGLHIITHLYPRNVDNITINELKSFSSNSSLAVSESISIAVTTGMDKYLHSHTNVICN